MEITDLIKDIDALESAVRNAKREAARIQREQEAGNAALAETADFIEKKVGKSVNKDAFLSFFKKPYAVIPNGKNKVLVAVPKFVQGFQVGWLWKETDSFFIYQFDQYSSWLGEAPSDLMDAIDFERGFELKVSGNTISFDPSQRDAIKKKLGYHLKQVDETSATIVKGHAFDVIAETIKAGCLPFAATPVSKEDLRAPSGKIQLRPYQDKVRKKFIETGAVGAFQPTGAGKSFISLYLLDIIKGSKCIIVPTRTLVDQWYNLIETHIPERKSEIKIFTYAGFRDFDTEYALTVFDECQRLPADTFSRMAVMRTKYRIGLSASPHREDGRENYIFALTGFPVGLNWREYMETVGKTYHPVYVHVVRSAAGKMRKLGELLNPKKRTFIFCDTIALGKEVSRTFGVPYIYGETQNRIEEVQANKVVAISRVGDLGLSVKDLNRIIEIDFLFGSREQELQRTGRLMHSDEAERHDIIMTEAEFQSHGKRLWALQEKGFTVKVAE